ncbi:helix-turn-helix domain-containing protein [Pararhodobacter zhoushanensis]|uniref:Helix-turn-helix domain-containing protein n=1 Tax=Pararhodobacter zhoushanensis TaxID=2479545 RepID=A0ABT3GU62_9RHOB|nr:helix-turn-helix domain-containing protein [Pararhodobacter zhoushanensis]
MSSLSTIRSLQRGIAILQAVNHLNGTKPSEIAEETGIPRPSVYRLLETLAEMGLVTRDHFSNKWRPTLHVKSLSSGFRDEDWVCDIAVPHMIEMGRRVLWPLDLVTFRNHHMEVRESTHQLSPYSINHGMVGKKLPVLETSSGRVMLAFMPEDERRSLLTYLGEVTGVQEPFMMADGSLDMILKRVREMGVGFRMADFTPETGSISAPIWYEDRVFACVTLIWSTTSLKFPRAVELYRKDLLETAARISHDLVGNLSNGEIARLRAAV